MVGGSGAPDLLDGLSNLNDRSFDFIVNPYSDTASLDAIMISCPITVVVGHGISNFMGIALPQLQVHMGN